MTGQYRIGVAALVFSLVAGAAAAQSLNAEAGNDRLKKATGIETRIGSDAPRLSGVRRSLVLPRPDMLPPLLKAQTNPSSGRRDSVWNGALIGAGVGAVSGAVWGLQTCGSNDTECFAIAGPVGILGGAGIGAVVGAIADALVK